MYDASGDLEALPQSHSLPQRTIRRALVVDDNAVNRKIAATYLERLGIEAATAANSYQALLELSRQQIDLVIMDIVMPGMDGLELTKRIRALNGRYGSSLVILGWSTAASRRVCVCAGMNDTLPKPLLAGSIEETLKRICGYGALPGRPEWTNDKGTGS